MLRVGLWELAFERIGREVVGRRMEAGRAGRRRISSCVYVFDGCMESRIVCTV